MNSRILTLLQKRILVFAGGRLNQIKNGELIPFEFESDHLPFLPVIIIGKEHYQENNKRYPVSNRADLNDVLKFEESPADLFGTAVFMDDYCTLPQVILDIEVKTLLEDKKWNLWLPESWVLNINPNELHSFTRAGIELLAISISDQKMLTVKRGPFKSVDYFLMSAGANESVASYQNDEQQYIDAVRAGLEGITQSQWISILKAQRYPKKLAVEFDWKALIGGVLSGVLIFHLSLWGFLQFKESSIERQIQQQDVASVIKLQKEFEKSTATLLAIQNGGFDKSKVSNLWDMLLFIMEQKVTLIKVTPEVNGVSLILQSRDATDTLDLLRNHSAVRTVAFSSAVRKSAGKDRFSVLVTFNSGTPIEYTSSSELQDTTS